MAEPSTSEEKTATSPPPRRRPLAARLLRDVAITLAVVLGGTAAWAYLFVLHPAGTGPAGPAVPAEPFRREWSDRKVLLLGIGGLDTRPASYLRSWYEQSVSPTNASRVLLTHWDDFSLPLSTPPRFLRGCEQVARALAALDPERKPALMPRMEWRNLF